MQLKTGSSEIWSDDSICVNISEYGICLILYITDRQHTPYPKIIIYHHERGNTILTHRDIRIS